MSTGKKVVTWDELRNALRNIHKALDNAGLSIGSGGSEGSEIDPTESYVMAGLTLTDLTASKPVFTNADKELVSTGTMPVDQGGLGMTAYTTGDLLVASAAAEISKLAAVAAGSVLASAGVETAPAWSTDPTLTGITLSGLTASLPVVSDATKALVSLAYTGAVSFRKNLGLETDDDVEFQSLVLNSLTPGSVVFVGTGDLLTEDNANLFWNDTQKWLGVGCQPEAPAHVKGRTIVETRTGDNGEAFFDIIVGPKET